MIFRLLKYIFGRYARAGKKRFRYTYSPEKKSIRVMSFSSWDLKKVLKMQASIVFIFTNKIKKISDFRIFF